jgi:predicted MPP superfamily phosphohydrolase
MTTGEKISLLVFLLTVAAIYGLEGSLIFVSVHKKFRHTASKSILLSKPAIAIHFLAAAGIICFLYGYFVEPYWIEVNTLPIHTTKLKQTSFRLVQISDLHCDKKVRNERKIVKLINRLHPDAIVFTGDALNTAAALPMFKDTMKNLEASIAKLAVYGNFEIRFWRDIDLYGGTGFQLLKNDTVLLRKNSETLCISGLSCDNPAASAGLLQAVPKNHFSVFLYHYPDLIEYLNGRNVDLYLCGHTHGGQVALPFYGALITLSKSGKKYESGMYTVGRTTLYVNRGIGLEGGLAPRVRFLARPEITVFDIQPEK